MSTKIYEAWAIDPRQLTSRFLPSFRRRCLRNVVRHVEQIMAAIPSGHVKGRRVKLLKVFKNDAGRQGDLSAYAGRVARFDHVEEILETASASPQRDPNFCIDAKLGIWFDRSRGQTQELAYAIPFGEPWVWDGFGPQFGSGGTIREFGYWDNVEKPGGVSAKEWRERARVWDRIMANWDERRLTHTVFDIANGVGTEMIRRAILPDEY